MMVCAALWHTCLTFFCQRISIGPGLTWRTQLTQYRIYCVVAHTLCSALHTQHWHWARVTWRAHTFIITGTSIHKVTSSACDTRWAVRLRMCAVTRCWCVESLWTLVAWKANTFICTCGALCWCELRNTFYVKREKTETTHLHTQ